MNFPCWMRAMPHLTFWKKSARACLRRVLLAKRALLARQGGKRLRAICAQFRLGFFKHESRSEAQEFLPGKLKRRYSASCRTHSIEARRRPRAPLALPPLPSSTKRLLQRPGEPSLKVQNLNPLRFNRDARHLPEHPSCLFLPPAPLLLS